MKKVKRDWRALKLLHEGFQDSYVQILCENLDLCGPDARFKFGIAIDALNGLRAATQEFIDELVFAEIIGESFPNLEKTEKEKCL